MDRLLTLYFVGGMIVGALGMVFYLFRAVITELDFRQQLPLLVSFSGFTLAVMSYAFRRLRLARGRTSGFSFIGSPIPSESSALSASFVARWRDIELALRKAVALNLGESLANEPVSALIVHLVRNGIFEKDDAVRIRRLLDIRNEILHKAAPIQGQDVSAALRDATKLLEKLTISTP